MLRNYRRLLVALGAALFAALPAALHAQQSGQPVRGDVDGDGQVTAADARIVSDFLVGRPVPGGVDIRLRADVNGDGRVTAADAAIIRAAAAGRNVSRFPVGQALPDAALAVLECTGDVRTARVECHKPGAPATGARADIIVGGQDVNLKLTSANVQLVAPDTFQFTVTVQNLLAQAMAADSGTGAASANGVRVFFNSGPTVTGGTGSIALANHDGIETFLSANQRYFQYDGADLGGDGILSPNETSSPRTWKMQYNGQVTFSFLLYVSAPMQFPKGWVDIYPPSHAPSPTAVYADTMQVGSTLQLQDTVRNPFGGVIPGAPVTWSNTANGHATVNSSGLVTAVSPGVDSVIATSGPRSGRVRIVVADISADSTTITADSSSMKANDTTMVTVQVRDEFGHNMTSGGATVTLTANSGGTLVGTTTGSSVTAVDNGNGTYTAKLTGTTAGTITVTGTLNGNPIPDNATVVINPAAPASLTKTAGDGQSASVGAAVAIDPAVHVADQYGNPVPGVTITFAVTGGGGSVTIATPVTDASGNAAVGSWTLGSGPATNALQASASPVGTTTPVSFAGYVPPTAQNDSSQAMGNTQLGSSLTPNVLTGDATINGGAVSIKPASVGNLNTVRGGIVSLAADGTWSYTPPAGNVLRDSVAYEIQDTHYTGGDASSAWIKIRFVGKVWYVDNTNGGAADGRDTSPFTSVGAAATAAGVNDSILVRTGSGTTTGGTLKNGQLVYAQGATAPFTATINGTPVTLLSSGSAPSIGALTLGSGNTLRGFTGSGGITGTSFGTLTVTEVALNNPSGQALSLTTGTLSGNFSGVTSDGGTNNILLTNVQSSGTSFGSGALSGASGDAVKIDGQNGSFSYAGTITNAAARSVNVLNKTGGTVAFSGTVSSTGSGTGISVASNSAGSVTFSADINPAAASAGISVTNNTGGTVTFSGANKKISSGASGGVTLTNNTGATIAFTGGGLAIATTTGTPFTATGGGTVEVGTGGVSNSISVSGAAANAVNLSGVTLGAGGMQFASITSSGTTTGSAFTATNVGNTSGSTFTTPSLTVAGTAAGSNRGLALTTNSAPFTFTSVSINGTGGEGIYLNGNTAAVTVSGGTVGNSSSTTGDALAVSGGNAAVTVAASLTKSTAGRIANIASHTAGNVTVSGALSCTGSCTGINVASNSGGTIDFSNATKTLNTGASAAVTLSSNTGATINFSGGGLAITTTSGGGFSATGGGTVTVTGSPNTITTTTGTGLTVTSTEIGSGGLTFRSVTSAGAANGIALSSTGTAAGNGGLTVTGNGTNGSGGSITNTTGADGATSGIGVYLSNTKAVSLSWMALSGHANHGIFGTGVRGGLTLDHVRLTGNNGTSNSGTFNESALRMDNIGGPVKITNSRFDGGAMNAVRIDNSLGTSPTLDSLVFENDTVQTMQGSTADVRGSAMLVTLFDGTADVRFRNNRVLAWWSTGIHVLSQGTASATARISNNFVDNTNGALAGASGIIAAGCRLGFNISANTVRHTNGAAIASDMTPGCTQTVQGTIDGNTIGVSGDAASGTATGVAIAAAGRAGTTTVKISNNILRQIAGSASGAITTTTGDAAAYGGSGTMNATISGNNIQESASPVNNAQHGILVTHGTSSGPPNDTHQGCYDIQSNTIANFTSGTANNRIRVNQRFGTTSRFPGYTGAATGVTSQTDLASYLLGRNTASTSTNANTSTGGFLNTSPAGSACPQPSM